MILLTTVAMEATKKRITAKESIASVPNQNSVVEMASVFPAVGCVVSKILTTAVNRCFESIV